jgi:hypothetical protein
MPPVEERVSQPVNVPQPAVAATVQTELPKQTAASVASELPQFGLNEPAAEPVGNSPLNFADAQPFSFSETADVPRQTSKPAAKDTKAGGLKSLLSVFSRKPGATPAKSKPVLPEPPVEENAAEPVAEEPPAATPAEQQQFSLGFGEPVTESPEAESHEQSAADDDFQKFLQQF